MATQPSSAEPREQREQREQRDREQGKSQLVVVDLGRAQTPKRIRQLRKGRGRLVERIDRIVSELVEAGTVKATAQPVIFVVREIPPMPWPFSNMANEYADYDDDRDDEDDDD
jgi:hypothetical protein